MVMMGFPLVGGYVGGSVGGFVGGFVGGSVAVAVGSVAVGSVVVGSVVVGCVAEGCVVEAPVGCVVGDSVVGLSSAKATVPRAERFPTVRAKARASTNIMDKIFFMFFLLDAPAPGADGDER